MVIAVGVFAVALVALCLCLMRLALGPTLYDRALAAVYAVICATLISAAAAVSAGRSEWLDAGFAAILALVATSMAILKFFRSRTFQAPITQTRGDA